MGTPPLHPAKTKNRIETGGTAYFLKFPFLLVVCVSEGEGESRHSRGCLLGVWGRGWWVPLYSREKVGDWTLCAALFSVPDSLGLD